MIPTIPVIKINFDSVRKSFNLSSSHHGSSGVGSSHLGSSLPIRSDISTNINEANLTKNENILNEERKSLSPQKSVSFLDNSEENANRNVSTSQERVQNRRPILSLQVAPTRQIQNSIQQQQRQKKQLSDRSMRMEIQRLKENNKFLDEENIKLQQQVNKNDVFINQTTKNFNQSLEIVTKELENLKKELENQKRVNTDLKNELENQKLVNIDLKNELESQKRVIQAYEVRFANSQQRF